MVFKKYGKLRLQFRFLYIFHRTIIRIFEGYFKHSQSLIFDVLGVCIIFLKKMWKISIVFEHCVISSDLANIFHVSI